jgi:Fur family ferric uptake transcriptional regulator
MKHLHTQDFETTLREKGLKSTPLRIATLEILTNAEGPLTAEETARRLEKINFDRATLYRTLKTFCDSGLIQSIDLGEGFLRYERNCKLHHHHHHIICTSCKEIEIVPFCIPHEFKRYLSQKGYKYVNHRMDFTGICKNCD